MAPPDAGSVARLVARVDELTSDTRTWTADRMFEASRTLVNERIAGADSDELLVRSLAICREAVLRATGVSAPKSAVAAAAVLAGSCVASSTSANETLAAIAMCAYWHGLAGDGVHVVAIDEKGANRYRGFLMPALKLLGCDVGLLTASMGSVERRQQYSATLTVGSYLQFASDYLRDNLQDSAAAMVQRGLAVAVVGDACGTLVGNSLVNTYLSGPRSEPRSDKAERIAAQLRHGVDYRIQPENGSIRFSESGIRELRRVVSWAPGSMAAATLAHEVEETLLLRARLLRSDDLVVADITTQGFLRNYGVLVGVTGSSRECAAALARMYELECSAPAGAWRIKIGRRNRVDEPSSTDLSFERVIDEQRAEIYSERAKVRDRFDLRQASRSVIVGAIQYWSAKGIDEISLGLREVLSRYGTGRDIAVAQSSANSLEEVRTGAERILKQAIADRGEEVGNVQLASLMRRIQLTMIDQQWAQHLARVRFVQRHGNLLDGAGMDVPRLQEQEIARLYLACRQRIREYTIAYSLNVERW